MHRCLLEKSHQLKLTNREKGGEKDNVLLLPNVEYIMLPNNLLCAPSSFVYVMAVPVSVLLTIVIMT